MNRIRKFVCYRPLLRGVIAVCFLLSTGHSTQAIVVSPNPGPSYAAQTWLGFSSDDDYTIRLTLEPSGKGRGFLVCVDGTSEPFEVTSWRLEERNLVLAVHFKTSDLHQGKMSGAFKSKVLSYTTTGPLKPNDPMRHLMDAAPSDLPGPLELLFINGDQRVRFGAWPETEFKKLLEQLGKVSERPESPRP